MASVSKNIRAVKEKIDRNRLYNLEEAIELLKEISFAKFDETIEVAMKLGVNPRHAEQIVRGTCVLPHGTGKTVRILALTQGEKINEAEQAGADYVGLDEFIEKIQGGWLEFDIVVATPDVMSKVSKLGKILGPRKMMPNPKSGTLDMNIGNAIKEIKRGQISFRVDKAGIIHAPVGKKSFDTAKLVENCKALFKTIIKMRPPTVKGRYLKGISISSTMGPGLKIDPTAILNEFR